MRREHPECRTLFFVLACAFVLASAGCATGTQKDLLETAMANDAERARAFEATARALDEHPGYVDELYAVARHHPAMFRRFLDDTARDLRDPALAGMTAQILVLYPASLEETLVMSLDAARPNAQARAAIDRAIVARKDELADIQTDDHDAVVHGMNAVVAAVERKPAARRAFLEAMRDSSPPIAEILKGDPDTMKVLVGAVLREDTSPGVENALKKIGLTK